MSARVRKPGFNTALNGYRGLCALLVFFFHLGSAGVVQWPGGSAVADGLGAVWMSFKYGVEMFFMISGYVILGSLLRHATVRGFLQDRAIRIFSAWIPALLAVTAVCLVFRMKVFADITPLEGFGLFIANLFLLPPIVHIPMIHQVSWSLSYEWVFYLVAALSVFLYRHSPPRRLLTACGFALGALFIVLFPRSLYFVTGVLVFRHRDWFARHRQWLRFPLLSLLLFLVAWHATGADKAHLNDTLIDYAQDGRWVAAVVAFLASLHAFACITLNTSVQTAFLTSRLFQFLGNISYSFYLWHALVMSLVKRVVIAYVVPDLGSAVGLVMFGVVSMAISIPVSWASWRLFEGALAQRARKSWSRPPVVQGGAARAI